jgi:hypothetical protein
MNTDGTFCLGLEAGSSVSDASTAKKWWNKLGVFLSCQETAFASGTWPEHLQISHGDGGKTEVQAEELATEYGIFDDYRLAVESNSGPIAGFVCRVDTTRVRMLNGRAACVCGRKGRGGKPLLRRKCGRSLDRCVVLLEVKRRLEVKQFWAKFIGKKPCCGTMHECPLK